MIVALGFPLNVAAIILGSIFSTLLSVFSALGPISNPTPPTAALTEFFHADTVASDHPLPVSWYLISSVCVYLCYILTIFAIMMEFSHISMSCKYFYLSFFLLSLSLSIYIYIYYKYFFIKHVQQIKKATDKFLILKWYKERIYNCWSCWSPDPV